MPCSSTAASVIVQVNSLSRRSANLVCLNGLVEQKNRVLSQASKIAGSGMPYAKLRDAFCRGADGLRSAVSGVMGNPD